jgi:hypothetical protein
MRHYCSRAGNFQQGAVLAQGYGLLGVGFAGAGCGGVDDCGTAGCCVAGVGAAGAGFDAGFENCCKIDPPPPSTPRSTRTTMASAHTINMIAHQVVACDSTEAAPRGPNAVWLPAPPKAPARSAALPLCSSTTMINTKQFNTTFSDETPSGNDSTMNLQPCPGSVLLLTAAGFDLSTGPVGSLRRLCALRL